tara:strand:- start:210 stop:386 length:177 start_codon:yes stop_codon:yes gene_type:complete
MRYRGTIYVDIWAEEGKVAGRKLDKIVKSIPNSFSDGLSPLPHGSEISLIQENPDDNV